MGASDVFGDLAAIDGMPRPGGAIVVLDVARLVRMAEDVKGAYV